METAPLTMGVRNYLIEGMSGVGKTSVAEELQRRGYDVVHGDRKFAYTGDPETGEPLTQPDGLTEAEAIAWGYARWIWPVDRVKSIIADHTYPVTFFCGGTRNAEHFIHLFDKVFILEVDLDTLTRRVAGRGDDEFGGTPSQLALLTQLHASRQGLPTQGIVIDSIQPLASVVDEILSHCL